MKVEEHLEYREGLHQWMKNNDLDGVIKKAEKKYTYDHLARKLLNQHAWIRVPWYIPLRDTHPPEKKNYGPDLIAKINELEERIKSK